MADRFRERSSGSPEDAVCESARAEVAAIADGLRCYHAGCMDAAHLVQENERLRAQVDRI